MERLVLAAVLVGVAVVVALVIDRRRPQAPTQPREWPVPSQLDRTDFAEREKPWLVVVFTSVTCESCAKATSDAQLLAGPQLAVEEVEAATRRDLHARYGIEAVPTIVLADDAGVVRASFVGPPSATELWAAVAAARGD